MTAVMVLNLVKGTTAIDADLTTKEKYKVRNRGNDRRQQQDFSPSKLVHVLTSKPVQQPKSRAKCSTHTLKRGRWSNRKLPKRALAQANKRKNQEIFEEALS